MDRLYCAVSLQRPSPSHEPITHPDNGPLHDFVIASLRPLDRSRQPVTLYLSQQILLPLTQHHEIHVIGEHIHSSWEADFTVHVLNGTSALDKPF
jgi:hypothetical protein